MAKRELVLVVDDGARSALPDAVADISVRIVDWDDEKSLQSIKNTPVLIDIDLRNARKIQAVKDHLPEPPRNRCRIVIVDPKSHHLEAQANGLGASDLLKRPLDIRALRAVLQRHFPNKSRQFEVFPGLDQEALEKAPGGLSIASAAVALHQMFTALTLRRPLEISRITEASDRIADSIDDIGLAAWLKTVRAYHEGTYQHCLIITGVATAFGHGHNARRCDVLNMTIAALLHDIGKAQIPLEILDKPAKLSAAEFSHIKRHPEIGYDYLCSQKSRVISVEIADVVRHHHEYLDGSGYPDGLRGPEIKDMTRILTVCDVYGALVEKRPYRLPNSPKQALETLYAMANDGKLEADLVRALEHCVL
jgi:putative nucleotidyltransferase with HDIG domain